jgi:hypothetical protein
MKKEIFLFSVILTILLFNFSLVGLSSVYAQGTPIPVAPPSITGRIPPQSEGIIDTVNRITTYLVFALLLVAVFMIVLAGYTFVTAQGDPEKVGKARNYIIYAMIGVAVALLARAIISLVRLVIETNR